MGSRGTTVAAVAAVLVLSALPARQALSGNAGRRGAMAWRSHGTDNASMVSTLKANGVVRSPIVETSMRAVDRANFVDSDASSAYADSPQPIGHGQTISAPHMHAHMLEKLAPCLFPGAKVLDVGSGSGYLSAVIASAIFGSDTSDGTGLAAGIEVYNELATRSKRAIANVSEQHRQWLESGNIVIEASDGWSGRPCDAPYDAIHVGAAASKVPDALVEQLKPNGRLVIPVGQQGAGQELLVLDKQADGTMVPRERMGVMFVPLSHTNGKTL